MASLVNPESHICQPCTHSLYLKKEEEEEEEEEEEDNKCGR
jgi:hypothetical protein